MIKCDKLRRESGSSGERGGDGWGEMMLYVGLEAPQDIIDDLAAALDYMNRQG